MPATAPLSPTLPQHLRDLDLFGRLFAEWQRGRSRRHMAVDAQLDVLDAQLARLEQAVTMAVPARPLSEPSNDPLSGRPIALPLAVCRT